VKEGFRRSKKQQWSKGALQPQQEKVANINSNNQPAATATTNTSIQTALLHIPAIVIIHLVLVDHSDSRMFLTTAILACSY